MATRACDDHCRRDVECPSDTRRQELVCHLSAERLHGDVLDDLSTEAAVCGLRHDWAAGFLPGHMEALPAATVREFPLHSNLAFRHRERAIFGGIGRQLVKSKTNVRAAAELSASDGPFTDICT